MRRLGFGAAVGMTATVLAAGAFVGTAGAQRTTRHLPADTAARAVPDTGEGAGGVASFAARHKLDGGYFVSEAQLANQPSESLARILATHIPGLRVVYGQHRASEYLVSTRGEGPNALVVNGGTALCYVQAFVDGSFIQDGDISWIRPTDVSGAEYYDVTRTPPAYRRPDGQCGVLLVWMKTGG